MVHRPVILNAKTIAEWLVHQGFSGISPVYMGFFCIRNLTILELTMPSAPNERVLATVVFHWALCPFFVSGESHWQSLNIN
jgi:hypothetical protein